MLLQEDNGGDVSESQRNLEFTKKDRQDLISKVVVAYSADLNFMSRSDNNSNKSPSSSFQYKISPQARCVLRVNKFWSNDGDCL